MVFNVVIVIMLRRQTKLLPRNLETTDIKTLTVIEAYHPFVVRKGTYWVLQKCFNFGQ